MLTRTTTALLHDLHQRDNDDAWQIFDARYRPILVGFGRSLGLDPEDAADVAQDAIVRFMTAYGSGGYDRSRGRLRSWLIGIARNCARDLFRHRARRREWRGSSAIVELPGESELEALWEESLQREIMQVALVTLREESRFQAQTIRAYELVVHEQRKPADAARELGLSPNDVYLAKHRCLSRLREIVTELRVVYDLDED